MAELITALAARDKEIERLNKWADGFSDAQIKERLTGEKYQIEPKRARPKPPSLSIEPGRDAGFSNLHFGNQFIAVSNKPAALALLLRTYNEIAGRAALEEAND